MANQFPVKQMEQHFKKVLLYAPAMLGNDAVNFFFDSFKNQGWLGSSFQPWVKRKAVTKWGATPRNNGRAILVDTGRLKRSIRITSIHHNNVTIGTDVPYAKAHNEGLRLGFIEQVRPYERRVTKLGISSKKQLKTKSNIKFGRVDTGNTIQVQGHRRRVNMKLPQRQFMGNSPYLAERLNRRLQAELMKGLRTL